MKIKINKDWKFQESYPTISGYVYLFNAVKYDYPFEKAIRSFSWCDELIVVNANHEDDGTEEVLNKLKEEFPHVQVHEIPMDLDNPGCDGECKSIARALCTSEYLIQFDSDEFCLGSIKKWKKLAKDFSETKDILELPVLEPFGDICNLRLNEEHNPLKWRLSRNKPEISHGIPIQDRLEKDGKVFSKGGSDGCFYVHIVSGQMIPSYLNNSQLQKLKQDAKASDEAKGKYIFEIERMLDYEEPCVLHVGHVDLRKKIDLYLENWHHMWCNLYGKDPEDPENNKFFPGLRLEYVTEKMVKDKVKELTEEVPIVKIKDFDKYLSWKGLD